MSGHRGGGRLRRLAELEAAVQQPGPVHADETHWRQAGEGRWLWVVVSATATVFRIAASRGSAVIKDLLGKDFAGWLITDRYAAYTWVFVERRQVCWAHLSPEATKLWWTGVAPASPWARPHWP